MAGSIAGICGVVWGCACLFCFTSVLWKNMSARFLSAVVLLLLSIVIVWLLYILFISLVMSLAAEKFPSFDSFFGMLSFHGKNLTVFAIPSDLVVVTYMR